MHLRLPEDGELGAWVWVSAFVNFTQKSGQMWLLGQGTGELDLGGLWLELVQSPL